MLTTKSIPGKLCIMHEAADTLKLSFTLSIDNTPIDLTGCDVKLIVSTEEYASDIAIFSIANGGLVAVSLVGGSFKIVWQTANTLFPGVTYGYRLVITFTDGSIRTYLQDKLIIT